MCGIAGVIHLDADMVRSATATATAALAHRGPDDEGLDIAPFGAGFVGLGHRRLAILELSPLGHQPMAHPPTGCRIVFNGEIYNFQRLRAELERDGENFRGGSDTEVLLAGLVRHGAAYLPRLEGMYAFAFLDPRKQTLLLARDPAGIKPLYLTEGNGGLAFASETRAVIATGLVPRRLDPAGVATFLAYGAVQHPLTVFSGVRSLPPGASLTVRVRPDGRWAVGCAETYWRLPPTNPEMSEPVAVTAVRDTLTKAVDDHLIADVPVGVFLSSGIDSTLIGGLAAAHTPRPRAFTVGFADQPEFDELDVAAVTAKRFGLDHTAVPLPASEAEAAASEWLEQLDQPSIDGLNVYVVSKAVRAHGIKVALSGLGADELFGGYPSFREVPRLRRVAQALRPLPSAIRRGVARLVAVRRTAAAGAKFADMLGGDGSIQSLCLHRRRLMSDAQLSRLGITANGVGLDAQFLPPEAAPDLDPDPGQDVTRAVSQYEFRLYQGNMLLRDADANAMTHGLELRVPFLDQRLLNLAHSIPGPARLPLGAAGKHLLRRGFPDLLAPELLARPKQGFSLPLGRWMAGPMRSRCERAVTAAGASGAVAPDGAVAVWRAFLAEPDSPMWSRALALVVLGEFVAYAG